ncbi:hypothetical protein D3C72_1644180 [compost metagenome]
MLQNSHLQPLGDAGLQQGHVAFECPRVGVGEVELEREIAVAQCLYVVVERSQVITGDRPVTQPDVKYLPGDGYAWCSPQGVEVDGQLQIDTQCPQRTRARCRADFPQRVRIGQQPADRGLQRIGAGHIVLGAACAVGVLEHEAVLSGVVVERVRAIAHIADQFVTRAECPAPRYAAGNV